MRGWVRGKIYMAWGFYFYMLGMLFFYAPRDWPLTIIFGMVVGIPFGWATRKWWPTRDQW